MKHSEDFVQTPEASRLSAVSLTEARLKFNTVM